MSKLRLTREGMPQDFNKVSAIKALRQLSGVGLKDAKDAVEAAMTGQVVDLSTTAPVGEYADHDSLRNLTSQGFEFLNGKGKIPFVIEAIKESAKLAADEEDEELAMLLLGVIAQHKENCERREREAEEQRELNKQRNHADRMRREELDELRELQEQRFQSAELRSQENDRANIQVMQGVESDR